MARSRARPADPTERLQNVGRLLDLKGWTQTELATRSGLATAYVNQLLTGRKKSPSLDALESLASAFVVSPAVLIDRRLSDVELRTELSQGALRAALADGISHAKFSRFRGTDEAPVTVEGWARLARILEIADHPTNPARSPRASRSKNSQRQ
jgi:transcriptional regulator with XRE-family HTH domain